MPSEVMERQGDLGLKNCSAKSPETYAKRHARRGHRHLIDLLVWEGKPVESVVL